MNDSNFSTYFGELYNLTTRYINSQLTLMKLKATEISTKVLSSVVFVIAGFLIFLNLFHILLFAFAFWYGEKYGSVAMGFLWAAGIEVLVITLILVFRGRLITRPLLKLFKKLYF